MAKLTQEMKDFFEKRDPGVVFIGTAAKNGLPNVAAKGTFVKVLDDETLCYADVFSRKTLDNVKENPVAAMAVVDVKTFKGYQFKGKAELITKGEFLDEAKKQNPQIQSITKIKVDEIYLMDYGPNAGKRLA